MPPTVKVTKDDILEAAFQLIKEEGVEAVNARNIAGKLNCSTKPIFRVFANMGELKKELFEYINQFFSKRMTKCSESDNPFLNIGLAYIDFAQSESNLFKALFLSDNIEVNTFSELISQAEHGFILKDIPMSENISAENMQILFMNIWLYIHGIATMMATNSLDISNQEIENLLKNAFKAFSG